MISAPLVDGFWRIRLNNSSAGGQLEQPSEVNSSTTTAFRLAGPGDGAGFRMKAPKRKTSPSSKMPRTHADARLIRKYYAFRHDDAVSELPRGSQFSMLRRRYRLSRSSAWVLRASRR